MKLKFYLILIIITFINCSKQDTSLIPSLLFLRNLNLQRIAPSIIYNFSSVRYFNSFDKDIRLAPLIKGSEPVRIFSSPPLPDGLVLDSKTGIISGSPTSTKLIKEQIYKISISNSYGSASTEIKLQIGQPDFYTESRSEICYNNTAEIPCGSDANFPRQDAEFPKPERVNEFHKNYTFEDYPNDYIFVDKNRAISWSCAIGQKGKDCSDSSEVVFNNGIFESTYTEAVNYCSSLNSKNVFNGFAGKKNWRLPEIDELQTLVHYNKFPAIKSEIIPSSIDSSKCDNYWSNTPVLNDNNRAWVIDNTSSSSSGIIITKTKSTNSNSCYHCVSGLTSLKPNFADNNDGTIFDARTNLVWQKCSAGLNNDSTCTGTVSALTWSDALKYCTNLTLAGKAWRLPSISELTSIVDYTKSSTATDSIFPENSFPNTNLFSTSTTHFNASILKNSLFRISFRIYISLSAGEQRTTVPNNKAIPFNAVRCVSDK